MSALLTAAREFLTDEDRRTKRRQRTRMTRAERHELRHDVRALTEGRLTVGDTTRKAINRGEAAVLLFGYDDTFDEKAATVITDILHAAAANGFSPQAVLDTAALYYAEERPPR